MAPKHHPRTLAIALLGLAICCAFAASSAQAKSISVSGTQTIVDEEAGTFRMHGDLVGAWRITSFRQVATEPLFRAKGTERFRGCFDDDHDGICAGDPSGTMRFRFRFWALFGSDESLRAGACSHPIVGGTGAFRKARGSIQMLDVPTENGVVTHYAGDLRTGAGATIASRRTCGA